MVKNLPASVGDEREVSSIAVQGEEGGRKTKNPMCLSLGEKGKPEAAQFNKMKKFYRLVV